MATTEAERVKAWAQERMGDGGKRVTIILDGESVAIVDSLKRPKESLHELFNRLLKDIAKGSEARNLTPAKDDNTGLLERILDGTVELLERVIILEQNSNATGKQYKTATEPRVDNLLGMKQDSLFCYETATTDQDGNAVTEQQCIATYKQYEAATEVLTEVQPSPQAEQVEQYSSATGEQVEAQESTPPVAGTKIDPALAKIKAMQDAGAEFDEIQKALRNWVKANHSPRTRSHSILANTVNAAGIVTRRGGKWLFSTIHRLTEDKQKAAAAKPDGPGGDGNG
ncbi:MAG: hypothetical protein HQK57_02815 [Deltaproteobacteria bacterium]|nr:hypothetical protein [Deltaproteobacteria bacterium]